MKHDAVGDDSTTLRVYHGSFSVEEVVVGRGRTEACWICGKGGVVRRVSRPVHEVFGRNRYREHIFETRQCVLDKFLQLEFINDLVLH